VITCEGLLLIMAKHFWGDHVAQFLGGRQSTLLLRKISRIGKRPAGAEETKYIGSDLTHLLEGIRFVSFMPSGLSGLMGGIAVLIAFMGWGGLAGIVVLYFMFWGNTKLAIMGKKADLTMQARGEDRIRVMKQVVHGIKAVKFYAWEESYTQLLAAARLNEVNASVRFKSLQIAGVVLGRASPIVGTAAVFIVRTAEGATMSASEAFATLAVFQTLRIGMIFLPLSLSFVAMLNNIMRGTERYLDAPEPQPLAGIAADLDDPNGADADLLVRLKDVRAVWEAPGAVATAATGEAATTKPAPSTEKEELEGSVDAEGVELTTKAGSGAEAAASLTGDDDDKDVEESGERDEGGFELRVPKLEVRRGAVVAVVGQVGAGKSMLLETVLAGEPWLLPPENDDDNQTTGGSSSNSSNSSTNFGREVHQASGVGYVPQAALVVSGTVRENVILDRPYDAQRFADAVRRSCFERDLSLLPHGDATVVGERGTTLSGGQQQRLSVARALYGTPGLLVMDDPLAAVDTVVGGKIFDTLLDYVHGKDNDGGVEGGKGKGRAGLLMVLNQLHLLPRCDQVVFMDHGKAACCGTYDQVLARSEGFRSYMSSYQEQSQSGGTADDAALNDSWADGPFQGDVVPMKNEEEVLLGSSSSSTSSSSSAEQAADKDAAAAAAAAAAAEGDAKAAKKDAPEAMTTSGEEPKQLITKEAKTDGVLSNSVLFQYLRSMGLGGVAMNQMILLGSYVCLGVMDLWLSFWTSKVDDGRLTEDNMQKSWFHLSIFYVLSCTFVVMQLVTCLGWVALCGVANKVGLLSF
jgi:ABC-type multidrug transport system fused ATPase/permease subunit